MDILSEILGLPTELQQIGESIEPNSLSINLTIASTSQSACCPMCQKPSTKIHSHYERTLADLNWGIYQVHWQLWVRKFFCKNQACPRKIFTERLAPIVIPYGRKTQRLLAQQNQIGLALGGKAGERLSQHLNYKVSRQTLLSYVSRLTPPPIENIKVLGVDDWAYRKGKTYGTILVDLEKRKPIALLSDRKGETFSRWLKEHPGIEIISRDRAEAYRSGADSGCPMAIQVTDRFHLLKNLASALEEVFNEHLQFLQQANAPLPLPVSEGSKPIVSLPPPEREKADIIQAQACRARRLANYEQTHQLHTQGWDKPTIAHHLGISQRTVSRFLKQPTFPERQENQNRGRNRCLDPYQKYLLDRWNSGCHHSKLLWQEIVAQGCRSSYSSVARFLRSLKKAQRENLDPNAPVLFSRKPQLTPRRAAWLVLRRPESLIQEDEDLLARLRSSCPVFEETIVLAWEFIEMVRERNPQEFDSWLHRASQVASLSFVRFAHGLLCDYEAVRAGLTLPWSNGQVEGQVNRLKMLKRQMYGRASLPLLSQRVLLAA